MPKIYFPVKDKQLATFLIIFAHLFLPFPLKVSTTFFRCRQKQSL